MTDLALLRAEAVGFRQEAAKAFFDGRVSDARHAFLSSVSRLRELGDRAALSDVMSDQAVLEVSVGRTDIARQLLNEALVENAGIADGNGRARHLRRMGDLEATLGNCDAAKRQYDASRAICRERSDETGEALSWLSDGALAVAMSLHDEARDCFDRAHVLHLEHGNAAESARLFRLLGDLERKVGRNEEAQSAYGEAEARETSLSLLERGYLKFGLGDLARLRSEPHAEDTLRQALASFQECDHCAGEGQVRCALGEIARGEGDDAKARTEFDAAIVALKRANSRLGLGNAWRGLGLVERNLGSYTEARKAFRAAELYYRASRNRVGQAHALRGKGEIDHLLDQNPEARENLQRALKIYEECGQLQGQANALLKMGELEHKCDDLIAAKGAYRRAMELSKEAGDPIGQAYARLGMANIEIEEGLHVEARRNLTQAAAAFQPRKARAGMADCSRGLAELELAMGHLDEAQRLCEEAERQYEEIGQELGLAQMLVLRARVQIALKHEEDAARSLDQAAAKFDVLGQHRDREEATQWARKLRGASASQGAADQGCLVILLHGIRTNAGWMQTVKPVLEEAGFSVACTNYERLGTLAFWLPFPWFRAGAMKKVKTDIESARNRYPARKVSFIAHSFGSYVLARLLHEHPEMRAERIIFCGSIVPARFKLEDVITKVDAGSVLNEVGTHDPWPAIAAAVTWGYGSVGTFGFHRPLADDRWHARFVHSSYLDAEFCRKYWVPYLTDGTIVRTPQAQCGHPRWFESLHWIKRLYWTILAGALVAAGTVMAR